MTIFKYQLDFGGEVLAPEGAKFLSVGNQNEHLVAWAIVNPNGILKRYKFDLHETGARESDATPDSQFLGTVHFRNSSYILHVFGPLP